MADGAVPSAPVMASFDFGCMMPVWLPPFFFFGVPSPIRALIRDQAKAVDEAVADATAAAAAEDDDNNDDEDDASEEEEEEEEEEEHG